MMGSAGGFAGSPGIAAGSSEAAELSQVQRSSDLPQIAPSGSCCNLSAVT